jgi:putative two-component system response regulator
VQLLEPPLKGQSLPLLENNMHLDAKILIVDDKESNLHLLKSVLRKANYTNITTLSDPREVLLTFTLLQPDLILLDLMMPYLDGFEVMELLRPLIAQEDYLPILVLTADGASKVKYRALAMGAHDFLAKPIDTAEVILRVNNLLRTRFLHRLLDERNRKLEDEVSERTSDLREAHIEILERLAIAAEYRDDETGQHIRRVSDTVALLASALGVPDLDLELIRRASHLHDVGKIGIPDEILLKPGKLTSAEFEVMKTHTTIGAKILSGAHSDLVKLACTIAYTHHERWDGLGYPRQLAGDATPIEGRIVAVADVFDALTQPRPYKEAWPVEEALAEIERESGSQFDPIVVEALFKLHSQSLLPLPVPHQFATLKLEDSMSVTAQLLVESAPLTPR